MPIFRSSQSNASISPTRDSPVANNGSPPARHSSIFSRRPRSPNDDDVSTTNMSARSNGGFFNRWSSSDDDRFNGPLHKDPTIVRARQKVTDAENLEKAADQALHEARMAVAEARNHVQILEREAKEEAKRARAKQAEAESVTKSAKGLGRHG